MSKRGALFHIVDEKQKGDAIDENIYILNQLWTNCYYRHTYDLLFQLYIVRI